MRESPYFKSLGRQLPWVVGLAAVMAVIGPFGSYAYMGLLTRLVYFIALGLLFWLQIILLTAWFGSIEAIDRWPLVVRMALAGFVAAGPGTFGVFLLHGLLVRPMPLEAAPHIFTQAAFLSVAISVVVGLFVEQRRHAEADSERARVALLPEQAAPSTPTPDFFRRIPPALGRNLLALEMEDHYLRIHTAHGSDLILLRLRDALAELGERSGQQVHRSWWVAEGAVASADREGSRIVLVLRNGLRVSGERGRLARLTTTCRSDPHARDRDAPAPVGRRTRTARRRSPPCARP
jgi:DNA-binding LytR/AlgR family response regulator